MEEQQDIVPMLNSFNTNQQGLNPEQHQTILQYLQTDANTPKQTWISQKDGRAMNDRFKEATSRLYLCTLLHLSSLSEKAKEIIVRNLLPLNAQQLENIIQLTQNKNNPHDAQTIIHAFYELDRIKRSQRPITANKCIRNLAILGTILTLGCGAICSNNKEYMTTAGAGTVVLTALAVGAHQVKQNQQKRLTRKKKLLQSNHPQTFNCLQKIQRIVNVNE